MKCNKGSVALRARPHPANSAICSKEMSKEFSATFKNLKPGKCYENIIQEGKRLRLKWLNLAALAR